MEYHKIVTISDFIYSGDSGDLKSASELVKYAAQWEITVGADAMAIYLENEKSDKSKPGAWGKLKHMFWTSKK